jgi:hypothetical protein
MSAHLELRVAHLAQVEVLAHSPADRLDCCGHRRGTKDLVARMRASFMRLAVRTGRCDVISTRSAFMRSTNRPLANMGLDEITSERAAEFAAYRQAQGRKVSTVNSSLRVLRRILGLAVE